jgi:transcriptional regulator with XRE-family HTH domain
MHSKNDYPDSSLIDYENSAAETIVRVDLHYGQIVERIVRRDRMGISEIARKLDISRRTLYNWFETKKLNIDIICQIGFVIGHDFSKEFPEEFANKVNTVNTDRFAGALSTKEQPRDAIYYWMDRYIKLLEKFNDVLSSEGKYKGEGTMMFFVLISFTI